MKSLNKDFINRLFLGLWMLSVGIGFWQLFIYSNTPGEPATASLYWPAQTKISRGNNLPTLIMFVHPYCSCSDASVGELERLMPHIQGKVKGLVVFFKPKNKSEEWAKESLWRRSAAIPGVITLLDEEGGEAKIFGVKTSGQVFLYDDKNKLIFQGGITPERGHMGDSDGRNEILSFFKKEKIKNNKDSKTSVFGCSLKNPKRAIAGEKSL